MPQLRDVASYAAVTLVVILAFVLLAIEPLAVSLVGLMMVMTVLFTAIGWLVVQGWTWAFSRPTPNTMLFYLACMWFGDITWDILFDRPDIDFGSLSMEISEAIAIAINYTLYRRKYQVHPRHAR